ncbi:fibroblast growth factor 9 isoform X2 [Folsomia candida]|uniref:fibroblast growth factor 9 isoform X2 n=1 Tax=Folsomia candida TaxID=158441 RepID=UPI000B8F36A2|nr:fibroblast growth factor 9 isoform X2 [Folsomia candida]
MCGSCFGLCGREVEESSLPEPEGEGGGRLFDKVSREERDTSTIPGVIGRRRRIRRLHCRTGFDVAVYANGKIRGTKSPRNKYGLLEFEAAGLDGQLRIRGVSTGFYITMTPKGRIVGQPEKDQPD